jgi:nitroreductase
MNRTPEFPIDPQFTERWSPRAFSDEEIAPATLMSFFEAALWAPSSSNVQPWRFVYGLRGSAGFAAIFATLVEFNQSWAHRAAALVAVVSAKTWLGPNDSTPRDSATHSFDAGAAWGHLALQAHLAGWATHGMGGFDRQALRVALAVPEDFHIEALVAIGRRGDKAMLHERMQGSEQPNQRRPLAEIVAEGRFSF